MRATARRPFIPAEAALARLTFTFTVAAGQTSPDLDYASQQALTLGDGMIQDAAGNAALLSLPATGSDGLATRKINCGTPVPMIVGVSAALPAGAYGTGTAIPITVTFSEPVTVTGAPQLQLALNVGSGATAIYTGGSGAATLTFTYTPVLGQGSPDLDYASTAALTLNGGTIEDAAGNAALLTLPATGSDGLASRKLIVAQLPLAVQQAVLTASDGAVLSELGYSVAISGNTVVVGAAGGHAAYVFTESGSGWANMTQVAKLTASDGNAYAGGQFGASVAISGNTIVVGAPGQGEGAAYVFSEPASGWTNMTQTAELTASDGALNPPTGIGANFGDAVAISGNTVVVGAIRHGRRQQRTGRGLCLHGAPLRMGEHDPDRQAHRIGWLGERPVRLVDFDQRQHGGGRVLRLRTRTGG